MYYIYFHNWWYGFFNSSDKCNIEFFKNLFLHTNMKNFEITNDLNIANVLFEAGKPDDKLLKSKKWKYTILFTGEPVLPIYSDYDIIINSHTKKTYDNYHFCIKNNMDPEKNGYIIYDDEKKLMEKHYYQKNKHLHLSCMLWYIHGNNYLERLKVRPTITSIPPYFCCFIVTNDKCHIRNKMFHELSKYKKVHSGGSYCNNIGGKVPGGWMSQTHLQFISQHKFMICFENSLLDLSEKIINAYLSNIIPIYWGDSIIKDIFNSDSMIFLEDTTDESYKKLINKVIEIDNDNNKYLEMVNQPLFTENNKKYWEDNLTLRALGIKINKLMNN
jgi:hypothetical protein